jgi:hypothetical protein
LGSSLSGAETYYIDCLSGSDSATGKSISTAWRTLDKVTAMTFAPGDSILLKRGTSCAGQLAPKGSGDSERPIRIGAYGSGALPLVNAGTADSAIKLFNQRHWIIEALETRGGNPYGILVSGTQGELGGFVLKNLVVHDVSGEPRSKITGLVVFTAPEGVQMDDVLIDGITAYNTTQWAGIIVSGASREHRIRNVTIRNSIVHDVYGDGIVMFSVEDGLIERSAAWLTGLQPTETIGTPNAIWTWTCRRCTVRQTEGFFIDSPGVDGGVYDIDFGNDDNVVEDNYGHDAMGYCAAVFAAEKQITTNSVIRGNLCIDNGRSPKLARRQGDLFISTWEGGSLDGVRIENNTFYWSPLIDAPAVMMDHADFQGSRPNIAIGNRIFTAVSKPIHTSDALKFGSSTVTPILDRLPPVSDRPNRLRLVLTGADRAQVVFLQTALVQYPDRIEALLVIPKTAADFTYDWNLGRVQLSIGMGKPSLQVVNEYGKVVEQWSGFVSPAKLGLILRRNLGVPTPFAAAARNRSDKLKKIEKNF